jgi:hypothetical protein
MGSLAHCWLTDGLHGDRKLAMAARAPARHELSSLGRTPYYWESETRGWHSRYLFPKGLLRAKHAFKRAK